MKQQYLFSEFKESIRGNNLSNHLLTLQYSKHNKGRNV